MTTRSVRTFQACEADEACTADAGTDDLGAAYDQLAASAWPTAPSTYELPLPDGTTEPRELTATDLVGRRRRQRRLVQRPDAAADACSTPRSTRTTCRSPAWRCSTCTSTPRRSRWCPTRRGRMRSSTRSSARTTRSTPTAGTPRQRLDGWLADHADGDNDELRLGDVALGDLPCLYWPSQPGDVDRPSPIVDPPYPTFVLTADTDPATPMVNALRVFERLDDAYLVVLQDGPHVIFDWGYTCVDDLIAGYLGEGTPPATRITICDGDIIDPYAPDRGRHTRRDRRARRRSDRCDDVGRDPAAQQRRVHAVARRRATRVRLRLRRHRPLRARPTPGPTSASMPASSATGTRSPAPRRTDDESRRGR